MFERFNEEARRALFFARVAVSEHGGSELRDVHLLLGLIRASPHNVAAVVDGKGGVQALAECLLATVASPELLSTSVEVPFDTTTRRVLEQAIKEADSRGEAQITPEHLLVALIADDDGVAARCLRQARKRVDSRTESRE